VTADGGFVGRTAVVRDLVKVLSQGGNARIQGEKRVGKTSLAKAVHSAVAERWPGRFTFIELESGDFSANSPSATVARLGRLIATEVLRTSPGLGDLPMPDCSEGLAPLTEFFAELHQRLPDRHFVIVLDEFDALPHPSLYEHTPEGEALFGTIRSLGGKRNVSFILIGSERMVWVIANHGQTLNKFRLVPLEYFDDSQMDDYSELVRAPANGVLTFSDEAVVELHRLSAGNPYMSKLLLKELFERHVQRRDSDVQHDDVIDALGDALPKFGPSSFQHFWDDAIRGDVEDREQISATRRRVLLAFCQCLQSDIQPLTQDHVSRAATTYRLSEAIVREVIQQFLDRAILVVEGESLSCRVPLFELWLKRFGPEQIPLGSGDEDTILRRHQELIDLQPKTAELEDLVKRWGGYRGQELSTEAVAKWLAQFGGPADQRAIMPILSGLSFFSQSTIRRHLRAGHDQVLKDLASQGHSYKLKGDQRFRDDLLICGLEEVGSGASHLVKFYRHENGIYADNVVPSDRIPARVSRGGIRGVVVLEDFIGTGTTAVDALKTLAADWINDGPWDREIDIYLVAVCGFEKGVEKVKRAAQRLDVPVTVLVGEVFSDADRCFSTDSRFFDTTQASETAQALCTKFGAELEPRRALGYGDSQAVICFEHSCPNNSLPILWKDGPGWMPLFPRH
jgi:hypothetical protein